MDINASSNSVRLQIPQIAESRFCGCKCEKVTPHRRTV